jgi:hypothetical protein
MNKTAITFLIILLIFVYWFKKRGRLLVSKSEGCADLWDNMKNDRAEEMFFNSLSLIENEPETKDKLLEAYPDTTQLEYNKCLYTLKYLRSRGNPVISQVEAGKIENCICDKQKV